MCYGSFKIYVETNYSVPIYVYYIGIIKIIIYIRNIAIIYISSKLIPSYIYLPKYLFIYGNGSFVIDFIIFYQIARKRNYS